MQNGSHIVDVFAYQASYFYSKYCNYTSHNACRLRDLQKMRWIYRSVNASNRLILRFKKGIRDGAYT